MLAACATPSAPPIANTTVEPLVPPHGRYVGTRLGVEERELSAHVRLPAGMTMVDAISTSDIRIVIARRAGDLVILATDENGVVTDDVTAPHAAATHTIVADCDGAFLGLIPTAACPDGSGTALAAAAWNVDPAITAVTAQVHCGCYALHLGE